MAAHALAAQATEDENAASCAFYAPPINFRLRMWHVDSDGPSTSIIDLMFTSTGYPCSTLRLERPHLHVTGLEPRRRS